MRFIARVRLLLYASINLRFQIWAKIDRWLVVQHRWCWCHLGGSEHYMWDLTWLSHFIFSCIETPFPLFQASHHHQHSGAFGPSPWAEIELWYLRKVLYMKKLGRDWKDSFCKKACIIILLYMKSTVLNHSPNHRFIDFIPPPWHMAHNSLSEIWKDLDNMQVSGISSYTWWSSRRNLASNQKAWRVSDLS